MITMGHGGPWGKGREGERRREREMCACEQLKGLSNVIKTGAERVFVI